MTRKEKSQGLEAGWPGATWTLRADQLIWYGPGDPPTDAEIQDAYNIWLAAEDQRAIRENAEESAGISALIASVLDDTPDRSLEAAKVRYGLALLTKALTKSEPIALTEQQESDLNTGIQNLLTYLQNPS